MILTSQQKWEKKENIAFKNGEKSETNRNDV
jgi:hypothetical protein